MNRRRKPKMNATVHEIRKRKSNPPSAIPELQEKFESLLDMVKKIGASIEADRATMLTGREARAAVVIDLLDEHRALTVADVKKHLGVTMKTANRLLHHVSHAGMGVLMLEPAGATQRLVLFHPDQVAIDDPRKS
jgi:hypothetical protein